MEQATKKTILISIAIAAGLLLLGALVWFLAFIGQFSEYKDSTYRFSVKYPYQWKMIAAPQPGAAVVFVSPKENALDPFQENVNIAIEDVPPELASLKNFSDKIMTQMKAVFSNIQITQSKPVDFGGRKGYWVEFTAEKPNRIKILTVWTIKGGERAYILTYMGVGKNYDAYLPLVQEMIKSFTIQ